MSPAQELFHNAGLPCADEYLRHPQPPIAVKDDPIPDSPFLFPEVVITLKQGQKQASTVPRASHDIASHPGYYDGGVHPVRPQNRRGYYKLP